MFDWFLAVVLRPDFLKDSESRGAAHWTARLQSALGFELANGKPNSTKSEGSIKAEKDGHVQQWAFRCAFSSVSCSCRDFIVGPPDGGP
jgi:hypothetical protein